MSVRINPERLRHELARRGWDQVSLARAAGITENTVSAAALGRPIQQHVLAKIVKALKDAPIDELRDELIADRVPAGAA